ncbi:MAG: hypothetical protein KGO81_05940 [Bacteroidota bacterium]|nr:hypothetical protein [Bacteroidota bacterium]
MDKMFFIVHNYILNIIKFTQLKKRGQRYTNCIEFMNIFNIGLNFSIGDRVLFNPEKVEIFKSETSADNPDIRKYQELVLAGIDQIGIVKEPGEDLTWVTYPDGWELPVPTKYLLAAP